MTTLVDAAGLKAAEAAEARSPAAIVAVRVKVLGDIILVLGNIVF